MGIRRPPHRGQGERRMTENKELRELEVKIAKEKSNGYEDIKLHIPELEKALAQALTEGKEKK